MEDLIRIEKPRAEVSVTMKASARYTGGARTGLPSVRMSSIR